MKLLNRINRISKRSFEEWQLGFGSHMNCWGFTSMFCGFRDKPKWVSQREMEETLRTKTKTLRGKKRRGDILVYRDSRGELEHTAIFISEDKILHKFGQEEVEYSSREKEEAGCNWYNKKPVETRRVLKRERKARGEKREA